MSYLDETQFHTGGGKWSGYSIAIDEQGPIVYSECCADRMDDEVARMVHEALGRYLAHKGSRHMYDVTLVLKRTTRGDHVVVERADETIWIAPELMDEVRDPGRKRIPGDVQLDGDVLTLGTEGEGLGRLRYRLVGRADDHGVQVHVAELVRQP